VKKKKKNKREKRKNRTKKKKKRKAEAYRKIETSKYHIFIVYFLRNNN